MTRFRYNATDKSGVSISGVMEASDPQEVRERLAKQGYTLSELREAPAARTQQQLSKDELLQFVKYVSGLVDARLPLASGLRALAEESPHGRLRYALDDLATEIIGGATLEEGFLRLDTRLPKHVRGLVMAGVQSGDLGRVLNAYVASLHKTAELERRIILSLGYPVILVTGVAGLYFFFSLFMIPAARDFFRDWGILLPLLTVIVIEVSDLLSQFPMIVLAVFIVLSLLFFFGATGSSFFSSRIPYVGSVWKWSAVAQVFRVLAILTKNDMPLPVALSLASDSTSDLTLAHGCRELSAKVAEGESLSARLPSAFGITERVATLLHWGEQNRPLPDVFTAMAEMYETRAATRADFVRDVSTPLAFIIVVFVVAVMVSAIMVPTLGLLSSLA